jgi:hypothetical protein
MFIFTSRAFSTKFKCGKPTKGLSVLQGVRKDGWSAHLFKIGRAHASILMNDATLFSIIIPTKGIKDLDDLLQHFSARLEEFHLSLDLPFSAPDPILFLPRSNRSRIGSMNDAIQYMKHVHALRPEGCSEVDWTDLEARINRIPFKAVDYQRPRDLMESMLRSTG